MVQAEPQDPVAHLHAYQDAINRDDADAAATEGKCVAASRFVRKNDFT